MPTQGVYMCGFDRRTTYHPAGDRIGIAECHSSAGVAHRARRQILFGDGDADLELLRQVCANLAAETRLRLAGMPSGLPSELSGSFL